MTIRRLLIALAHPDDESFGSGGLIAKLVQQGVEVYYICATLGNRGTVAAELIEKHGSIEAVRSAELAAAAQILGFKEVIQLGYGDSGMMGTPDNDDPACLWQADEAEVVAKLVREIRRIQPQVMLTFDPFGVYGHPDHIFMHRAATKAFFAAGDAAQFAEEGAPYAPQKLYYTMFNPRLMNFMLLYFRLQGVNPAKAGANGDMNFYQVRDNVPPLHARIDVREQQALWEAASRCHASQVYPLLTMNHPLRRYMMSMQHLSRPYPEFQAGEKIESDIFAGVRV